MALDAEIRIPDTTLQDNDFKDGEILRGSDVNKIVSVLKAGVNENYKDLKESDTTSNEHISDEVRHITGQERDRWNNTYTKEELYTKEEVYNKSEVYNKNETYPKENLYTKEETYSKNETYPKESLYTKNEVYKKSETYPKESLYTKNEVYAKEEVYTKGETYSKNDVYTKDNVYTKSEVDRQINDRITAIGSADMQKAVYDTNSNGIVDNSEKLGGQLPSYYAPKTDVSTLQTNVSTLQTNVNTLQTDVSELQEKSYEIYNDESTLDTNGSLIRNMVIYGKSVQDGTPTPDNPIEIQSVVNPKVTVCGKNLLNPKEYLSTSNNTTLNKDVFTTNFKSGALFFNVNKKTLGAGNYTVTIIPVSSVFYATLYIYKGNIEEKIGVIRKKTSYNIKTEVPISVCLGGSYTVAGTEFGEFSYKIQIEKGSTATEYEPYKGEQVAILPYTLNAIPVSSGGNVTIDGQQYISDYVNVENKKLVRCVGDVILNGSESMTFYLTSPQCRAFVKLPNVKPYTTNYKVDNEVICDQLVSATNDSTNNTGTYEGGQGIHRSIMGTSSICISYGKDSSITSSAEFIAKMAESPLRVLYPLATQTETTLTDEEVSQFKALQTYVPTSSIIASSDVLAPKLEFNYNFGKGIDDLYRSANDIEEKLTPKEIVANTDLNDLTEVGEYYCATEAISSSLLHTPNVKLPFVLKVDSCDGDDTKIIQTIIHHGKFTKIAFRCASYSDGVWSWEGWITNINSKDFVDMLTNYLDNKQIKVVTQDEYDSMTKYNSIIYFIKES